MILIIIRTASSWKECIEERRSGAHTGSIKDALESFQERQCLRECHEHIDECCAHRTGSSGIAFGSFGKAFGARTGACVERIHLLADVQTLLHQTCFK